MRRDTTAAARRHVRTGKTYIRSPGDEIAEPPTARASLWLVLAFLLPNLASLFGSFIYDDLPIIVENERLHSWLTIPTSFLHGYWPDRSGLTAYRPVSQVIWGFLWMLGHGHPAVFHIANLLLGAAAIVLLHRVFIRVGVSARCAFVAALFFAVLPIHTETTTPAVGLSEPLAMALGLGAMLDYLRGRRLAALGWFALAVASKESAAAFAGLIVLAPYVSSAPRRPWPVLVRDLGAAGAVIGATILARSYVADGPVFIPPIDNPMSLVGPLQRILTALWIQILYVQACLLPVTLSADYSYSQIRLVMSLGDIRAWAGLGIAALTLWTYVTRPPLRLSIAWWVVLFAPTANLLFPIGTMMGERLAYAPSAGLCLLAASLFVALPRRVFVAVVVVAVTAMALRSGIRVQDWRNADRFYPTLV